MPLKTESVEYLIDNIKDGGSILHIISLKIYHILNKAGTDHESIAKLQESINKITNPLHELQLYKELQQSFDKNNLPFDWPSIREDQKVQVHDFRIKSTFNTFSVRASQDTTVFDQMSITMKNKDQMLLSRINFAQRSTQDQHEESVNDEEDDDRLQVNEFAYEYSTVLEKSDMELGLSRPQIIASSNLFSPPSKRMKGTALSPVQKLSTFAQ